MISRRHDEIEPQRPAPIQTLSPGQMPRAEHEATDVREYLSIFSRRRWLILGIIALVFSAGMVYTLTQRPVYESTAKIVVVTTKAAMPVSDNDLQLVADLQALKGSRSVQTQAEIMSSPDLMQEASLSLPPDLREKGFGGDSVPPWTYQIRAMKDTDVIEVIGRAYDPKAAAEFANSIAETYFSGDLERNNRATRQAREFAETEMAVAGSKLASANAELARFKKTTGLFAPDAQLSESASEIARLSLELQTTKTQVAATEKELAALRRELSRQNQDVVANTTVMRNPQFSAIIDRIDALNSDRAALLQEFTPGSREIRAIDERIEQEKRSLQSVTRTIVGSKVSARNPIRDTLLTKYVTDVSGLAAAKVRADVLAKELAFKQQMARELPERERGLSERVQRVALLQRRYEVLSNNYYALLLSEQATLPNGTLISKANIPDAPAYPNPAANGVFFLMVGIVLALVSAVVVERLDARLHDQDSVEQATGLNTLSIVPKVREESSWLVESDSREGPLLESFRILRNSLSLSGTGSKYRILAITSPGRGEGKSTTSVNLAVTMAMEGKRVLLVDADVRRPTLHKLLSLPNKTGLTNLLAGEANLKKAVRTTSTANLDCITSGPHRTEFVELLNSSACRDLFTALAETYGSVLIDCPPAVGLSDVQAISNLADGVLLVVSMHQSVRPQLDFAMRLLAQTGATLAGMVINRMDVSRRNYYYYGETCRDAESQWDDEF